MARPKDFDESEVLQKAICLFWDKGFNGTSMQNLVDGLGISRSSLYDTFGDKHQLYMKALAFYEQGYGARLDVLIKEAPTSKIAIQRLLELVVENLLEDKQRKGCFMVNAGVELANHDSEVSTLLCQHEQQMEKAFLKAIKRGQKDGEISTQQNAQALARFLNNTVKGMQVSIKTIADRNFYRDIILTALTVLG
jgi:TetR/AcrR family transcriptional repressor of nem operon